MAAVTVQAPAIRPLSAADEETIRAALHRLDENGRLNLYGFIVRLDVAASAGDVAGVRAVVMSAPAGSALRDCLSGLAGRRLEDLYRHSPAPAAKPPRPERRPRRVAATIGQESRWADRRTHWSRFDELDRHGWERFTHKPRGVYWRHRTGTPIGLTRRIWADPAGEVHAELELVAGRAGDLAAALCHDRQIGFSIGAGSGRHHFEYAYDPADWAPSEGRADLLVWNGCRIDEVSLTDSPLFAGTGVTRTW